MRASTSLKAVLTAAVLAAAPATAFAEPVAIPGADGIVLGGNMELADGKSLSDGVILMVHGTLAHAGMELVRGQQERLRERGYNSVAISLSLGEDKRTGMYGCDVVHRHRHEDAIDEIARWVDWLQGQDVGPTTVWGHSRGGNQAAWFAAEHPKAEKTDRYVLVAPATWPGAEATAEKYEKDYKVPLHTRLTEARDLVAQGKGDTVMENVPFIYCAETDATAAAFASYYADDPRLDTPTLLGDIAQPVLVVIGDDDDVVPDLAARMKEATPEGTAFQEIGMAGHMFRDFAADDLADAVAEYVPAH